MDFFFLILYIHLSPDLNPTEVMLIVGGHWGTGTGERWEQVGNQAHGLYSWLEYVKALSSYIVGLSL